MKKEILTFTINNEIFGIDVSNVSEIIRADYHVTPIPNSEAKYIGIFQPRDKVLTAIDLCYCLFESETDYKQLLYSCDNSTILHNHYFILRENQAWLVDNVESITEFDTNESITQSLITRKNNLFVTEVYKNDNNLIQIIDLDLLSKN